MEKIRNSFSSYNMKKKKRFFSVTEKADCNKGKKYKEFDSLPGFISTTII